MSLNSYSILNVDFHQDTLWKLKKKVGSQLKVFIVEGAVCMTNVFLAVSVCIVVENMFPNRGERLYNISRLTKRFPKISISFINFISFGISSILDCASKVTLIGCSKGPV